MSESVRLLVYGLGLLGFFGMLGSGPAVLLAPALPTAALAPVVGLAITASLLTTAILVVSVSVATWALLVPLAIVSAAVALARTRHVRRSAFSIAPVAAAGAAAFLLAVAPGLLRGTAGPFAISVFDAAAYVPQSDWIRDHAVNASLPGEAPRYDLAAFAGHIWAVSDFRIGVDATNAAASALFGTRTDLTLYACLGALFALIPLSVWVVGRGLGAGWPQAAFGSLYGISAAALMMVPDATFGNLAGLSLAPVAAFFVVRAALDADRGAGALAAILCGGLVAAYPEFVLPTALVAAAACLLWFLSLAHGRQRLAGPLRCVVGRLALVAAGAALIAPNAVVRAAGYLSSIGTQLETQANSFPKRFITVEDFGAWAFGIRHLYELPLFASLGESQRAFAVLFPMVLGSVALASVLVRPWRSLGFSVAPFAIALALGLGAYKHYGEGHCEYCMWKSFTFMLPFLGIGLALGADGLLTRASARNRFVRIGFVALATVSAVTLLRADFHLTQETYEAAEYVTPSFRSVHRFVKRVPEGAHVLIEGAESMSTPPPLALPAVYYELHGLPRVRLSFDSDGTGSSYFPLQHAPAAYYSPTYRYVVTAFTGVQSNRTVIARAGSFMLARRAPIDVVISKTGWALDPDAGAAAIPWITQPFRLRVSAEQTGPAALWLGVRRPLGGNATLTFERGGIGLDTFRLHSGKVVCVNVPLVQGENVVQVRPVFAQQPIPVDRSYENLDQPLVPRPKVLGVARVEARAGHCPRSAQRNLPLLQYGPGWQAQESDGARGGGHRWMTTTAQLIVGARGSPRPRTVFSASASSAVRDRVVSVRVGRRLLARWRVTVRASPVALEIPPGQGRAVITFEARPPAQPASVVTPGDQRLIAVMFAAIKFDSKRTGRH